MTFVDRVLPRGEKTFFAISEPGAPWAMQATNEIMESMGLANGQVATPKRPSRKRTPARSRSEAQKLIPTKKGNGRRTAALERCIAWIVAAAESFPVGPEEEIPPVLCLPCLGIKFAEKIEPIPPTPAPSFTRAPTPAPEPKFEEIMGVLVTPLRPSSPPPPPKTSDLAPVVVPARNGQVNGVPSRSVVTASAKGAASPPIQLESDLDKDLLAWMKGSSQKYIALAGQWPHCGRTWGHRMAQVACGFDVMTWGTQWTREIFPYFVGALFEMIDAAQSLKDLGHLEYVFQNSVYLDVLAEAAEFQTKTAVSVNLQNHYDDKYLSLDVANDLLRERVKA